MNINLFLILVLILIIKSNCGGQKLVIGIFSQPSGFYKTHNPRLFSLVVKEYVQMIQDAGADVVPINYKLPWFYQKKLLKQVNGVLMPGGGFTMWYRRHGRKFPKHYTRAAFRLVKYVYRINKKGDHFPIFGICLGFETIMLALDRSRFRALSHFDHHQTNDKIHELQRDSRMFRNIDNNLIDWVMNRKVLRFNHRWGVAPDKFRRLRRISRKLRITSTGLDREGKEFVNSFEGIKYPLYGVQYHPEKNKFNFKHREIDHSQNSIMFNKKMIENFIDDASKNNHQFKSQRARALSLINNYEVEVTKHSYMGVYFLYNKLEVQIEEKDLSRVY